MAAPVGFFVIVLLSLQIFLLTVAVDGLLAGDAQMAWVAAAMSVALAVSSVLLYRSLRGI